MTGAERVYLIGSTESALVKIGWTENPERRLRDLQTGSPVLLTLLALFDGGVEIERELHRHFADKRRHGEWFDLGPSPVEVVRPFANGLREPKHRLRYDHVTLEEGAAWFPDDPPSVHERMERECPTYKGAWKCSCDN